MGLGENPFETLWEKEKLLVQAISPFPTMFSTPSSKTEKIIFVKILLCGNELNTFVNSLNFAGELVTLYNLNSLQNIKFLALTKLKAFADYKFNVAKMMNSVCDRVVNLVGKGENAD